MGNPQHTGLSKYNTASNSGREKWCFDTGLKMESSPAIGKDGTIYVGSTDYSVYALYPNGTKKWSFGTDNEIYSSPAIGSNGVIYIGSDDDNLYAINPDGTLRWKFPTNDVVDSSPVIGEDGTIYVGSNDGALYALNPDGTLKWKFTTGDAIKSSAAIGEDGTVYVSSDDGCIYAIGNVPPAPPRNLRAQIGDGYVNLSWAGPTDDGGGKVLHYKVYRNSALIAEVSASRLWFNDTKVKVSSKYSYEVSAVNAVGEGNLSNFANVSWSTPTVPQNFKVVRGDGYVLLSWSAPASDGNTHIINYVIYRNGELLAKINSSSLSYNDSNVNVKNKYSYSVAAVNGVGGGTKTEAKEVAWSTPWQVRNLKYLIEGGMFGTPKLVLSWSAPKDNGGTKIKYYEVYLYLHGKWKLAGWSNTTSTSIDMGNYLSSTLFGGSQVIKVAVFAVNAVGYGQGAYIPATVPLPINWYVWAGIISGIIVAAVIVTLLYMKMRKKKK